MQAECMILLKSFYRNKSIRDDNGSGLGRVKQTPDPRQN
jgi:hypothetical protein